MGHQEYFNYLKSISIRGRLYRNLFLYPLMCRKLSGKVLDVGCGIGAFLRYRPNTIGLDINHHNVNFCLEKGYPAFEIKGLSYPFDNEAFDGAVLDGVLEHLEDPLITLQEINRVLKKNGKLIIGVPGRKGFLKDKDHKKFYDEGSLTRTLVESGFEKESFFYTPFKSMFLDRKVSAYCLYGCFSKKEGAQRNEIL